MENKLQEIFDEYQEHITKIRLTEGDVKVPSDVNSFLFKKLAELFVEIDLIKKEIKRRS